MVNGVSQINVQGAAKYAVRVQVDPDKLKAQQSGSTTSIRPCRTGMSISHGAVVSAADHVQAFWRTGNSITRTTFGTL